MSSPLIIFLILIIAIGAFFFGRWHGISQRSKALSEELKAKDDELNALKSDVNKHFDETARLFSNVTEEYKALYQHLATSSNKLSNRKFDLKLSSHTSGLVGLGNDDNSTNNEVIDSQATEVSDYATGSQQPRDYADDDMDDEYNPKQPSDDNEQKSNDSGNSSSKQDSEGSDIAIDDSSDSKSAEQPPSGEEVKPDKSTS